MHKRTEKNEKLIEELTFEEALEKLENILNKMEKEELPLEESLSIFQEGMKLHLHCRKLLTEAELRVEKLLQNGELVEYDHLRREDK